VEVAEEDLLRGRRRATELLTCGRLGRGACSEVLGRRACRRDRPWSFVLAPTAGQEKQRDGDADSVPHDGPPCAPAGNHARGTQDDQSRRNGRLGIASKPSVALVKGGCVTFCGAAILGLVWNPDSWPSCGRKQTKEVPDVCEIPSAVPDDGVIHCPGLGRALGRSGSCRYL